MHEIFLSVIVPCFDEMANLQKGVLDKMIHFLSTEKFNYELIIVDDGSSDGSVEFIENFVKENKNITLIKNQHTGKAGAITAGILKSKGKYVLFTDMDQATPIEEVNKLLPFAESKKFDVVIGSRQTERKGSPWTRKLVSKAAVILKQLLVGLPEIVDTQCGFKMFTRTAADNLFEKLSKIHHGFSKISGSNVSAGFDMELLYLAEKMGYKIKEVSVNWLHVETRRVNPVRSSIDGLMDLLIIKKNELSGVYNV